MRHNLGLEAEAFAHGARLWLGHFFFVLQLHLGQQNQPLMRSKEKQFTWALGAGAKSEPRPVLESLFSKRCLVRRTHIHQQVVIQALNGISHRFSLPQTSPLFRPFWRGTAPHCARTNLVVSAKMQNLPVSKSARWRWARSSGGGCFRGSRRPRSNGRRWRS